MQVVLGSFHFFLGAFDLEFRLLQVCQRAVLDSGFAAGAWRSLSSMLVKSSWSPSSCADFFIASSFETCCLCSLPVVGVGAVSPVGTSGPGGGMLA